MKRFSLVLGLGLTFIGLVVLFGCSVKPVLKPDAIMQVGCAPERIEPGHSARLTVQVSGPQVQVKAFGWGQIVTLVPLANHPQHYEGFIAVPLDTDPALYNVTVVISLAEQSVTELKSVEVIPRSPFPVSYITIQGLEKYDYGSESSLMRERRYEAKARTSQEPQPILETFAWPVIHGRISDVFGAQRVYNRGQRHSDHAGLDIAEPEGTTITAPAAGRVILVRPFIAHGNTVMVDHGFGVVSTYLHQKKALVEEGQQVNRGDVIGEVGSTGASTGPHLHFQINVNGIMIDPRDFLDPNQP
jgi:murein DD-endopeptidase MepM/ murein hydrolase activator NlpD